MATCAGACRPARVAVSCKPPYSAGKRNFTGWLSNWFPVWAPERPGKLLDRFRTPQAIFRASRTELEAAGVSGAVAQSIASGCTFEDAAAQQREDGGGGRRARHHGRPALSRSALREIFDPPMVLFARGRVELLRVADGRRGGHAASDALWPGGGGAAVGRPGARRPDHRQRNGARHRYRRAQGRAGGGRRYRGGAGLRRGRGLSFGKSQAGGGNGGQGADRLRISHGRDGVSAELSRSATASSAG